MSSKLDLDDIEQMCADILKDTPGDVPGKVEEKLLPQDSSESTQTPKINTTLHSETPTPAEPLEFVASPIQETAKVLQTASRNASRSTSRSRSTSSSNLRRKSSNVEDLAVDMPQELRKALESPERGRQMPELTISTPTRRSSARLEKLARQGTQDEIKRERESTSLGVLSPNTSKDPESAIVEAIRRASSHTRARTSNSAVLDSPGPSKPPLHRRVSSNVLEEADDLQVRPMINRSTSSQRTQRLESLAQEGDHEAIKRERDSTSLGVLSPNRALNPEQAIEQAVRRASSNSGRPFGKGRRASEAMEALARNGTASEIRAERESTSQGILRPNLETSAEESMASAIRRASQSRDRPASIAAARRRSSRLESIVKSPIEAKKKSPKSPAFATRAKSDSPVVTLGRGRRPSEAMQEISRTGTAAQIREERESTSKGILRPNLEFDPEDAIASAYRRASSSSASKRPTNLVPHTRIAPSGTHKRTASQEMEAIANKGSPAQIRAERESTSKGVADPTTSANPENTIEKAMRRASNASDNATKSESIARSDSLSRRRSSDVSEHSIEEVRNSLGTRPSHHKHTSSASEPTVPPITEEASEKEPGSLDIVEELPHTPKNSRVDSPKRKIDIPVSPDVGFNEDMDVLASPNNTKVDEVDPKDPTPAGSAVMSENEESKSRSASLGDSLSKRDSSVDSNLPSEVKSAAKSSVLKKPLAGGESEKAALDAENDATGSATAGSATTSSAATSSATTSSATSSAPPGSATTSSEKAIASESSPSTTKPDHEIVYLYVSMASGGRGAMQNYQKAQTILQSYNVEFTPVEVSMDERARRIWKYRGIAKDKKLPAVVRDGEIKLDFDELITANENEEVDEIIFEEF